MINTDQDKDNPLDTILNHEFDEALIKFASFISILHNKKLSPIIIFCLIINDPNIKKAFKLLTQIDNDYTMILEYLKRYPNLHKSKIIKNALNEFKHNNK